MDSYISPMSIAKQSDEGTTSKIDAHHAQIDGLRALAMIGVLYVHFWHSDPITENVRVSLFFVVSGFLITHILYSAKIRGGKINVFNFYIRRMLRLFPALTILVITAYAFDMDEFRTSALWHIFQLSNVRFAINEKWSPWIVSHLWSLNILEQFYLFFPLIIILLPLHRTFGILIAVFVMNVVLRVHGDLVGIVGWRDIVFAADPIASGAFFYFLQRDPDIARFLRSFTALGTSLLFLISPYLLGQGFGNTETYRILSQMALAVITVGAFYGYRGPIGFILGNKFMSFISKVSYGIFIYHLALWWIVSGYAPLWQRGPITFLVMSSLSCAVAILSWYAFEEPVSRLKSRFPTASR